MPTTLIPDDHDLGLQQDLRVMAQHMQQRRQVVGWLLGGGAAAVLGACSGGGGSSGTATTGTTSGSTSGSTSSGSTSGSTSNGSGGTCVANSEETAGPYPSDGSNTVNGMASNILSSSGVLRSDIRSSFGSSTTVAQGLPLGLTLTLVNTNNLCAPLAGYAVYLWHCTRDGAYSLYSNGLLNENYLRGVQVADSNGQVTFQSIYPGCYSGRYPHIHFEVYSSIGMATLYTNKVLTSQLAMPRDISSSVYNGATGYATSVQNLSQVTTSSDNVFGDNTAAQITAMTPVLSGDLSAGYTGSLTIGVPA
jgi:protocatechuate 3,4-dioxygenase beta subunit